MPENLLPLLATIATGIIMGLMPSLLSRLRKPLGERFGIGEASIGNLEPWFLLPLAAVMVFGGHMADTWPREVLFTGILLACLGLAALGMPMTLSSLIRIVAFLGAAWGLLIPGGLALMAGEFWGVDSPAAALNLGYFAVGVGAILAPLLVHTGNGRLTFRNAMLLLGFFCLAPAILVMLTGAGHYRGPEESLEPIGPLLARPMLWFAALAGFIALPLEAALAVWPKQFLASLGYGDRARHWWQIGFWVGFLSARLATGLILEPGWEGGWILVLMLVMAITLGNMAGAYGHGSGWGLLLMGFCQGPIWPCFLGLVMRSFPDTPITAAVIVYAVGVVGCLASIPLLGRLERNPSIRKTIFICLALNLVVAAPILVMTLA